MPTCAYLTHEPSSFLVCWVQTRSPFHNPMPSKSTVSSSTFVELGQTRFRQYRSCSSSWTMKNGRPDLSVQNPHSFVNNSLRKYYVNDPFGSILEVYPGGVSNSVQPMTSPGIDFSKIEQVALAKFTGKLRKGSASLGVTLGSWGQSSNMIKARLGQAAKALSNVHAKLSKDRKRLRRIRKEKDPAANLVLETEFGWRPLLGDVQAALGVIAGDSIPPAWITGRHKVDQRYENFIPVRDGVPGREIKELYTGSAMVTVAAAISVSNPNTFLLNHLGLLNPLEVAWDLIPWSFVVGAFVNVQAMIRSMTNEVGLNVINKSTTTSCKTTYDNSLRYFSFPNGRKTLLAYGGKGIDHRYRHRVVGSHPALKWQVRVPTLDAEGMLIVASLVVQRFNRINRLLAV